MTGRSVLPDDQAPLDQVSIRIGTTAAGLPFSLRLSQLGIHTHIVGGSGVGKSYLMEAICKQLIPLPVSQFVLTPHADLYEHLIDYCTYLYLTQPELELHKRVIPFDVAETRNYLGFNPVQPNARTLAYQAQGVTEAVRKCWSQESFDETPRLSRWLYNTAWAMIETGATFLQARDLLHPAPNPIRQAIINLLQDPFIRAEWEYVSQANPAFRDQHLESCFNRIVRFVQYDLIRKMLGQHTHPLDFSSVLRDRKIFLANLASQGVIHRPGQHLLGTLLINELLTAALAQPTDQRSPVYVFADEFQHFVTKDMCTILDEGRKHLITLTLGHQHLAQLKEKDPELYASVLVNARTKIVFGGSSEEDLNILAPELHRLNPDEIKDEVQRTYFRPLERSRVVTSYGEGTSLGTVNHAGLMAGSSQVPGSELWSLPSGQYSHSSALARQKSSAQHWSDSRVPFYELRPERELSSRAFRQLEEQLYIRKAQMKWQPPQYCQILAPGQLVQMVRVGTLKDFSKLITDRHRQEFLAACFESAGCFKSPEEVEREIAALRTKLLSAANPPIEITSKQTPTQNPQPCTNKAENFKSLIDPEQGSDD